MASEKTEDALAFLEELTERVAVSRAHPNDSAPMEDAVAHLRGRIEELEEHDIGCPHTYGGPHDPDRCGADARPEEAGSEDPFEGLRPEAETMREWSDGDLIEAVEAVAGDLCKRGQNWSEGILLEACSRLRGAPEGAGEGGMEREMGDSNSDVRDLSDEELVGPMEELGVRYCLDVGLATVPVLLHAAEIIRRLEGRQAEWAEQWAETVHQHLETLLDEGLHVERKHLAMAFNDLVGPFEQYGVSDEGLRTGREGRDDG